MDEVVFDLYQTAIVAQALLRQDEDETINDILSRIERKVDGLSPISIVLDDNEKGMIIDALVEFEDHDRGNGVNETLKTLDYYSNNHGKTTV